MKIFAALGLFTLLEFRLLNFCLCLERCCGPDVKFSYEVLTAQVARQPGFELFMGYCLVYLLILKDVGHAAVDVMRAVFTRFSRRVTVRIHCDRAFAALSLAQGRATLLVDDVQIALLGHNQV